MTRIYNRILVLILTLSLAPAAYAAGEDQGSLEVRIKDHREAIGDFSKLTLTFTEILISPKPGLKFWQSGWKSLTPTFQSIDLTKYVGKNSARVYQDKLAPGSFDAINLRLKQIEAILKPKQRSAHRAGKTALHRASWRRNCDRSGFSGAGHVRPPAARLRTRGQRLRALHEWQTRR